MLVVAWGLQALLGHVALFSMNTILGQLLTIIVVGGIAGMIYIGGVLLLRVEEVALVRNAVMAKLGYRRDKGRE